MKKHLNKITLSMALCFGLISSIECPFAGVEGYNAYEETPEQQAQAKALEDYQTKVKAREELLKKEYYRRLDLLTPQERAKIEKEHESLHGEPWLQLLSIQDSVPHVDIRPVFQSADNDTSGNRTNLKLPVLRNNKDPKPDTPESTDPKPIAGSDFQPMDLQPIDFQPIDFKPITKTRSQKFVDWIQNIFSFGDESKATAKFIENSDSIASGKHDPATDGELEQNFQTLDLAQKERVFNSWLKTREKYYQDSIKNIKDSSSIGQTIRLQDSLEKNKQRHMDNKQTQIETLQKQFQHEITNVAESMRHFLSPDQALVATKASDGSMKFEVIDMSKIDITSKKPILEQLLLQIKTHNDKPETAAAYKILNDDIAKYYAKKIEPIDSSKPLLKQLDLNFDKITKKSWQQVNPEIQQNILEKLGVKDQYNAEIAQNKADRDKQFERDQIKATQRVRDLIEKVQDSVKLAKDPNLSDEQVKQDILSQLDDNEQFIRFSETNKETVINELLEKYRQNNLELAQTLSKKNIESRLKTNAKIKQEMADNLAKIRARNEQELQNKITAQKIELDNSSARAELLANQESNHASLLNQQEQAHQKLTTLAQALTNEAESQARIKALFQPERDAKAKIISDSNAQLKMLQETKTQRRAELKTSNTIIKSFDLPKIYKGQATDHQVVTVTEKSIWDKLHDLQDFESLTQETKQSIVDELIKRWKEQPVTPQTWQEWATKIIIPDVNVSPEEAKQKLILQTQNEAMPNITNEERWAIRKNALKEYEENVQKNAAEVQKRKDFLDKLATEIANKEIPKFSQGSSYNGRTPDTEEMFNFRFIKAEKLKIKAEYKLTDDEYNLLEKALNDKLLAIERAQRIQSQAAKNNIPTMSLGKPYSEIIKASTPISDRPFAPKTVETSKITQQPLKPLAKSTESQSIPAVSKDTGTKSVTNTDPTSKPNSFLNKLAYTNRLSGYKVTIPTDYAARGTDSKTDVDVHAVD